MSAGDVGGALTRAEHLLEIHRPQEALRVLASDPAPWQPAATGFIPGEAAVALRLRRVTPNFSFDEVAQLAIIDEGVRRAERPELGGRGGARGVHQY